jgi:hypothetical protein
MHVMKSMETEKNKDFPWQAGDRSGVLIAYETMTLDKLASGSYRSSTTRAMSDAHAGQGRRPYGRHVESSEVRFTQHYGDVRQKIPSPCGVHAGWPSCVIKTKN